MRVLGWALALCCCLFGSGSHAVEIYRNSVPYNLNVYLPGGESFLPDGVDRKFDLGEVTGNLRLIQDHYSSCLTLIQERETNWRKRGFEAVSREAKSKDCSIGMRHTDTGERISSFYTWIQTCNCFASLHFAYDGDDRDAFLAVYQPILDSLRANDRSRRGDSSYAANTDPCLTKDRFNCQYLSCPEQRARGMMADPDEYNICGLPVREAAVSEDSRYDSDESYDSSDSDDSDTSWSDDANEAAEQAEELARLQREREQEAREAEARRKRVVFRISSEDNYDLQVEFYSQTRKRHVWPGNSQVYVLPAGETREFALGCQPGEKICYGAWRDIGDLGYWGAGREGRERCERCCAVCGSGEYPISLARGSTPQYARSGGGGGGGGGGGYSVGDAVTDLLNGAALGLGIANGLGTYSSPAPAPRGRDQRPSGISR